MWVDYETEISFWGKASEIRFFSDLSYKDNTTNLTQSMQLSKSLKLGEKQQKITKIAIWVKIKNNDISYVLDFSNFGGL